MKTHDLVKYALDHGVVTIEVEWDGSDPHGMRDIDLDKGVDSDDCTVDGGLDASMVRAWQNDEITDYDVSIVYQSRCECCGHAKPVALSSLSMLLSTDSPEPDRDELDSLIDFIEPEDMDTLRELVRDHKRGAK